MSTFLVTGGNGYIGSHMCKLLFTQGHKVIILDNGSTSSKDPKHEYGHFILGDISDKELLSRIFKQDRVDAVFHFAAKSLVPEGEEKPFFYYYENFTKTMSLLESCVKANVRKFIFSSTCATFGIPDNELVSESTIQKPINTYGQSKLLLEMSMRDLCSKNLIDVTVLRYFNACGGSPDGEIGENFELATRLIPNICRSIYSGEEVEFKLYGDDFQTRDGSGIRDYIHVDDLSLAHQLAFDNMKNKNGFFDYNLGTGSGSTVLEVVTAFENVLDKKVKVSRVGRRAGDPPALICDTKKSESELGFRAKYSLEDSIRHTLNYLKKNGNEIL